MESEVVTIIAGTFLLIFQRLRNLSQVSGFIYCLLRNEVQAKLKDATLFLLHTLRNVLWRRRFEIMFICTYWNLRNVYTVFLEWNILVSYFHLYQSNTVLPTLIHIFFLLHCITVCTIVSFVSMHVCTPHVDRLYSY